MASVAGLASGCCMTDSSRNGRLETQVNRERCWPASSGYCSFGEGWAPVFVFFFFFSLFLKVSASLEPLILGNQQNLNCWNFSESRMTKVLCPSRRCRTQACACYDHSETLRPRDTRVQMTPSHSHSYSVLGPVIPPGLALCIRVISQRG